MISLNEDFLHFIWKFQLYNHDELQTTDGDLLEVICTGSRNVHSGPDFENAKVVINETLWVGNIEIHVYASDWDAHLHSLDLAYANVILHVVYEKDKPIYREDGTEVQTLVLKGRIHTALENCYHQLISNLNWIPCEKSIHELDELYLRHSLSRVLAERLEEKSLRIKFLLNECKGSWEDAFYVMLAHNFGFKTNALPFEMLARSLPQKMIAKHIGHPYQIESLIFGQSGLLQGRFSEEYPMQLQKEYKFLAKKYHIRPLEPHIWKFLRLRPENFPTVRLSQFAALMHRSHGLFSKVMEADVSRIKSIFSQLPIHTYWETHYRFDKTSNRSSSQLGIASINNILSNTIVPFLFNYGAYFGLEAYQEKAFSILEDLPYELNRITKRFIQLGVTPSNAAISQALLHLKKHYCDRKRCLNCGIGTKLLKDFNKMTF